MKMKKYIPLGTALLSAIALCSVFFKYMATYSVVLGKKGDPSYTNTMGDNSLFEKLGDETIDGFEFFRNSGIFYIIALALLVLVIVIAVLNFLGIGGKGVGYTFIGISFLAFVAALIAMIFLFKTKTLGEGNLETGLKFAPALSPWWITIFSFLGFLSTGNVLLNGKGTRKRKK